MSRLRAKVPTIDQARIFARDGFRCVKCGNEDDLTIDHIHPVCYGGTNEIFNLQTLCRKCNMEKGTDLVSYIGDKLVCFVMADQKGWYPVLLPLGWGEVMRLSYPQEWQAFIAD